jgi:hypothetical protein
MSTVTSSEGTMIDSDAYGALAPPENQQRSEPRAGDRNGGTIGRISSGPSIRSAPDPSCRGAGQRPDRIGAA